MLNLSTGDSQREFHQYVKPTHCPRLTMSCINKTKISQNNVDRAQILEEVLEDFKHWLDDVLFSKDVAIPVTQRLSANLNYLAFGTWSHIDIATNLRRESAFKQIKLAEYLKYYVDVQKLVLVRVELNIDHLLSKLCESFFLDNHRSINQMKQRKHTAQHSTRLWQIWKSFRKVRLWMESRKHAVWHRWPKCKGTKYNWRFWIRPNR